MFNNSDPEVEKREFEYDVFISYRTKLIPDSPVGEALQSILEKYPIPRQLRWGLVTPRFLRNRLRVFRDTTDLSATSSIDEEIKEKLLKSRWLIVVCTPNTPQSEYCTEEIKQFSNYHGYERILPLLVDGEPIEAFPAALINKYHNKVDCPDALVTGKHQPLAADVRANTTKGILRKLHGTGVRKSEQAKFKLLAPILSCKSPDDLIRRHRSRIFKQTAILTSLLLVALFVVISLIDKEKRKTYLKVADALMVKGISERSENRLLASQLFMKAAATFDKADDALSSLDAQLAGSFLIGQFHLGAILKPDLVDDEVLRGAFFSPDGYKLLTLVEQEDVFSRKGEQYAQVWSSHSKKPVLLEWRVKEPSYSLNEFQFNLDGSRVLAKWPKRAEVWNSFTGELMLPAKGSSGITGAIFSPDGKRIVTWNGKYAHVKNSDTGQSWATQPLNHDNPVNGALFSHDGKRLLTWSGNKAKLWDLKEDQRLTLDGLLPEMLHGQEIFAVRFSSDDRQILTLAMDRRKRASAKVWDSGTGTNSNRLITHNSTGSNPWEAVSPGRSIIGGEFSNDGKYVMTQSPSSTRIWASDTGLSVEDGEVTDCINDYFNWRFAVQEKTHNGTIALRWTTDEAALYAYEKVGGRPLDFSIALKFAKDARLIGSKVGYSGSLARKGNGFCLMTISPERADEWRSYTGEDLFQLLPKGNWTRSARFSRNGKQMVSWRKNTLQVWGRQSELLGSIFVDETIEKVTLNHDGSRLLIVGKTIDSDIPQLQVRDSRSGAQIIPPPNTDNTIMGGVFSRDGKRVLTWEKNTVRLWDSGTGQELLDPPINVSNVFGAAFLGDEEHLLTWKKDGSVMIWDSHKGKQSFATWIKHDRAGTYGDSGSNPLGDGIDLPVFSQDDKYMLTWNRSEDLRYPDNFGTAQVWDTSNGLPLAKLKGHWGHYRQNKGAIFNPKGDKVLTWGNGVRDAMGIVREPPKVTVWDSKDDKILPKDVPVDFHISGARFSPTVDSGHVLAWGHSAVLWDRHKGRTVWTLPESSSSIDDALFNHEGNRFLTRSHRGITVWDSLDSRSLPVELEDLQSSYQAVFSSNDSKIIVRTDGSVRVWDSHSGKPAPPMKGRIYDDKFSMDDRRVFTWGPEGARLWVSDTGRALIPLVGAAGEEVLGAALSRDEKHVFVWGRDTVQARSVDVNDRWPREELALLVEVQTGTRLDQQGVLHLLSVDEWETRKCRYDTIREELELENTQVAESWQYHCNEPSLPAMESEAKAGSSR